MSQTDQTGPFPVLAIKAAAEIKSTQDLTDAVREAGQMKWECDAMGFTPCGQYRVLKVVVPNAAKVIGYILLPNQTQDLAAGNRTVALVNVPLFLAPQGIPYSRLEEAVVKRGMPDWFACGTPPRKNPQVRQKEADGWQV